MATEAVTSTIMTRYGLRRIVGGTTMADAACLRRNRTTAKSFYRVIIEVWPAGGRMIEEAARIASDEG